MVRILGGHAHGLGYHRKSEFPEGAPWNDNGFVRRAIEQTMRDAHFRTLLGNRHIARREIDGVILEVGWRYVSDRPVFVNTFPVNGHGVGQNINRVREPRPLDRTALQRYDWRRGD